MADVSHAAAEALRTATEALRAASEAMHRASQVYKASVSPSSAALIRTADRVPLCLSFVDELPATAIPPRTSSTEQPARATLLLKATKAVIQNPAGVVVRPQKTRFSPHGFAHVDVLRAVCSRDLSEENIGSRHSTYSEEVADRNIHDATWTSTSDSDVLNLARREARNLKGQLEHSKIRMSLLRELAFLAVVCLAQFLTMSALSCTIAPLPYLTASFPAPQSPTWYSAAYSLTLGTFILPSGRLGDVFGHKKLFLIGWLYFCLLSVLCGFATLLAGYGIASSEVYFVAARALQGIGPAILMPNSLALLGRVYEQGIKKNLIFALFGWFAPVGFVGGAVMSSFVAVKLGCQWMFWLLSIACFLVAALAHFVVPDSDGQAAGVKLGCHETSRRVDEVIEGGRSSIKAQRKLNQHRMSWRRRYDQLDVTGSVLGVTALVLLNISLNQAPIVGWAEQYTYFLVIIALMFFSLFFISQLPLYNDYPLIPLDVMDASTLSVLLCTFAGWAAFAIWIFYTFDYLTSVASGPGLTPFISSIWFSPAPVSGLFASAATGLLLSRLHPRLIMLFSMLAFFIGTTFMSTSPTVSGHGRGFADYFTGVFWAAIIMPWGMDMSFPSATILLSNSVGAGRQGVAASLVATVVNYGISVGLGIAGTVVRYTQDNEHAVVGRLSIVDCRHAWYAGMGLSGAGVLIAAGSVVLEMFERRRKVLRGNGRSDV